MPKTIDLVLNYGMKDGDDAAPHLERAVAEMRQFRDQVGYARFDGSLITSQGCSVYLSRDVNLNCSGTKIILPINLRPQNGASLWLGGPEVDVSGHWVNRPVWGSLMPSGRKSFAVWSAGSDGQASALKDMTAGAALNEETDWSSVQWLQIDLCFGRDREFVSQWHPILCHEQSPSSRSAPLRITAWRNGNHADINVEFTLEDGPLGERFIDKYVFRLPDGCLAFARRDISIEYQPGVGMRAWVGTSATDRVRVNVARQSSPPARANRIASNRELGPLSFPGDTRPPSPDNALVLHGLRIQSTSTPYYAPCSIGGPLATSNPNHLLTDKAVYAPDDQIVGSGFAWSMVPGFLGRSCSQFARGKGMGYSAARVLRLTENRDLKYGKTHPLGMYRHMHVEGITWLKDSYSRSSGPWTVGLIGGWILVLNVENCTMPEGGFALWDSTGESIYPATFRNISLHDTHSGIIVRQLTQPEIRDYHVAYVKQCAIRVATNGGAKLTNFNGSTVDTTLAIILDNGRDTSCSFLVESAMNNNEGGYRVVPLFYTTGFKHRAISINGLSYGQPAAGKGGSLLVVDRRIYNRTEHFQADIGWIVTDQTNLLDVQGPQGNIYVTYRFNPALMGAGNIFPEDSRLISIAKEIADLKAARDRIDSSIDDMTTQIVALTVQANEFSKERDELRTVVDDIMEIAASVTPPTPPTTPEDPAQTG